MQEELSPDLEIAITRLQLTVVLTVMAYLQNFRRVTSKVVEVGNRERGVAVLRMRIYEVSTKN